MRKTTLTLHRSSIRLLTDPALRDVAGGCKTHGCDTTTKQPTCTLPPPPVTMGCNPGSQTCPGQ